MIQKLGLLALLLVGMFVLAACESGPGTGPGPSMKPFRGGTEGVTVTYEADAPPREVNKGDAFYVMLILNNKGEYTVPTNDYFVRLKGFSPSDFGTTAGALIVQGTEDLQANVLDPYTGQVIDSYEVLVTVPADNHLVFEGNIAGNTPFPFLAELCYTYKTTANAQLCIKQDLSRTSDTKVCTLSGPQAITSSGAPVQLSNFIQSRGGGSAVRFSFNVVAASTGGKISERSSECESSIQKTDRIYITVNTGIPGLSCTGFLGNTSPTEGYIKLSAGSRTVTCTQQLTPGDLGDYVKIVEITAEYDYLQSIQKSVLVIPYVG